MTTPETFTMYSTTWCGFCSRLRTDLERAGIDYTEIDVDRDESAGKLVESLNNGNRVVPTLVFADGSSLTNPSLKQVQGKLAS